MCPAKEPRFHFDLNPLNANQSQQNGYDRPPSGYNAINEHDHVSEHGNEWHATRVLKTALRMALMPNPNNEPVSTVKHGQNGV